MDTISDAVFNSWDFNPWLLTPALVTAVLYARGWRRLYKRAPHRFGFRQFTSFYAGTHNYSLRTDVAARCFRRMAADRTHDSTPLVDDDRGAAPAFRRALLALLFGLPVFF